MLCAAVAAALMTIGVVPAVAEPASGPREDLDQTFTTTAVNAPTGSTYKATYHAANDPKAPPPYMRRMVFYPPAGMRYDTSLPGLCTASDIELQAQGPAACPADSKLGEGTVGGIFYAPITHAFEFDRFEHHIDVLNNTGEQIVLIHAEDYAVVRGKVNPDNTLDFVQPSCYPEPPTGCSDDYVLLTKNASVLGAITKNGRSYLTTPPTCPASGKWATTIRFWWSDDSTDTVVTNQPCDRPATRSKGSRRCKSSRSKAHGRQRGRAERRRRTCRRSRR
jgi:hypothetical protein